MLWSICFLITFQSSSKEVNQIRNNNSLCCRSPRLCISLYTHHGPLQCFSTYFRKSKEIGTLRPNWRRGSCQHIVLKLFLVFFHIAEHFNAATCPFWDSKFSYKYPEALNIAATILHTTCRLHGQKNHILQNILKFQNVKFECFWILNENIRIWDKGSLYFQLRLDKYKMIAKMLWSLMKSRSRHINEIPISSQ